MGYVFRSDNINQVKFIIFFKETLDKTLSLIISPWIWQETSKNIFGIERVEIA